MRSTILYGLYNQLSRKIHLENIMLEVENKYIDHRKKFLLLTRFVGTRREESRVTKIRRTHFALARLYTMYLSTDY